MTLGVYRKIFRVNLLSFAYKNSHKFILNNIKHFRIISELLKILYNYVSKSIPTVRAWFKEPKKIGFTIFGLLPI
jgi:hypothetical protein